MSASLVGSEMCIRDSTRARTDAQRSAHTYTHNHRPTHKQTHAHTHTHTQTKTHANPPCHADTRTFFARATAAADGGSKHRESKHPIYSIDGKRRFRPDERAIALDRVHLAQRRLAQRLVAPDPELPGLDRPKPTLDSFGIL
eukprot:15014665-Alexandrium_andersonii.AAC.1